MENLLQKNPMLWTISLFLFMFALFIYFKPKMTFGPKGSIKPFGVQKRGSTVFPLWWWTFIMAVISRITIKKLSGH
jgi:quinol-cytochrome oxidoreductase complex cytochrome b subunit